MIQYILAAIGGYLIGDSINKYAKGGEFKGSTIKGEYFKKLEANFSSTRKGGVKNYSVDIDLEGGEQLRGGDLDFKDGNDALFLYERVKQKGEYQHEKIEDIQLIINFKNGDYETVDIPKYAKGSTIKGKDFSGNYYSTNDFVGANKLEKQAEKILGKGWEAEDDVNQIESIINSLGGKYVVTVPEDRSQWNEMREKYDLANTTNDSNYDIFVITKFTGYANGGELEGIGSKKSFGQLDFDQLEDIFNVQLFGIEEDETEKLLDELKEEWLEMTEEQRGEILDKYDIEYAKGGGVRRVEKNKNN